MKTADFFYSLPPELIAQQPAPCRTQARMMFVQRAGGAFRHHQVSELPALLRSGDLLVVNDTRVIPARLYGRKVSGGRAEILLIEETAPDIWEALLRASRPRKGDLLELASGRLQAEVLDASGQGRVTLRLKHQQPLRDILDTDGVTPLPPYIKRTPAKAAFGRNQRRGRDAAPYLRIPEGRAQPPAEPKKISAKMYHVLTERSNTHAQALDRERYQTVYARHPGAVAAPTAGLHFTKELLAELEERGIRHTALTLHVGPGTFQPVRAVEVEQHRMEAERYTVPEVTARLIRETRANQGRVVAVGSTVVRALETVASEHGSVRASSGRSSLFIYPPYTFRVVDALLTNFHLPASSLLIMVSAFAGYELIRQAYQEAIRQRYRFYSYGDCMLIL